MHMFMLQIKYDIREGIIQQWKKYAVLCVIYIACIVQFIMLCGANRHIDTYTCGDMVMWMFDGVKKFDTGAKNNVDISSVYILPNVFIAYIIGNYVIKDLYGYGKDILIRTGNRIKWWLSKCIWCVLASCMCYAVLYAVNRPSFILNKSTNLFISTCLRPDYISSTSSTFTNITLYNKQPPVC